VHPPIHLTKLRFLRKKAMVLNKLTYRFARTGKVPIHGYKKNPAASQSEMCTSGWKNGVVLN